MEAAQRQRGDSAFQRRGFLRESDKMVPQRMVGGIVRDGTIGTDVIIRTMQTLVAGGQDGKCPALVAVIVVGLLGGRFRTIGTLTQQLVHDSRLELVHQVKQLVHGS